MSERAHSEALEMNVEQEVLRVLDEVLSLGGRSAQFTRETHLLGAVPELDSMAVVNVIAALEEHFGIRIEDDDIDGAVFETLGSLVDFAATRVSS